MWLRSLFLVAVASVVCCPMLSVPGAHPAIGILTIATNAHLNEAAAFPGLSVFGGERLSTDSEGRLGVRLGQSKLTLHENTEIELISLDSGLHVDLSHGSLQFSVAEGEGIEVHACEALIWPASPQSTQGRVTILAPKVLQIAAERGSLNFSYQSEFRNLPEGQTYQIYLDAPAEPQGSGTGSSGVSAAGPSSKVVYFIVSVAAGGASAWGIHNALNSSNPPISPAVP